MRARHPTAGFSLIELVVVVAVMSVLAVGASLMASRGDHSPGRSDLQRFQQQFETAHARAIQGRQQLGFEVTVQGFRLKHHSETGWHPSAQLNRWRSRVVLQSQTPRQSAQSPHIVLLPNGQTSAFTLSFSASGDAPRLICTSDGYSELSCGPG